MSYNTFLLKYVIKRGKEKFCVSQFIQNHAKEMNF